MNDDKAFFFDDFEEDKIFCHEKNNEAQFRIISQCTLQRNKVNEWENRKKKKSVNVYMWGFFLFFFYFFF